MRRLAIAALTALAVGTAWAGSGRLTVVVEQAKVRKSPQFYAAAIGSLAYGDSVEPARSQDGWHQVAVAGRRGWVHSSALSRRRAAAKGGSWSGEAQSSEEEISLAGKGFNEQVESSYRGERQDLDYEAVERMVQRRIPEEIMLKFMASGRTLPKEAR